jgi:hypothetical protein
MCSILVLEYLTFPFAQKVNTKDFIRKSSASYMALFVLPRDRESLTALASGDKEGASFLRSDWQQ